MANVLDLDTVRCHQRANQSLKVRYFWARAQALIDALEEIGEPTHTEAMEAFRSEDPMTIWQDLYAAEKVLARVLWGPDEQPPELLDGETYDEKAAGTTELRWWEARTFAAADTFGDDPDDRAAAWTVATKIMAARGDRGPWPALFHLEQLAYLVTKAEHDRKAEAAEGAGC